ncbi:MAG: hypothetical protein FJ209_01375 [Betaproteobacteria bacterium]|nr:hypothetical protein [Betaproteobacteria bacterium]
MLNVLPFVAGLIAGAAAVSAMRGERARSVLQDTGARLRTAYDEAQSGVRTAARSGFDLMRGLTSASAPAVEAESAAPAKPVKPARKPAARKSVAKAASAKAASAKATTAKPKATRAPRKTKPEQAEA